MIHSAVCHLTLRVACVPSRDCVVDPSKDAGDPCVHPREVGLCAPDAPGDDPDEGVPVAQLKLNKSIKCLINELMNNLLMN